MASPLAHSPRPPSAADGSPAHHSNATAASPYGSPSAAAGAGAPTTDRLEGMRREWNFRITLAHQPAKALLHLVPQWESSFTPPEVVEKILKEAATIAAANNAANSTNNTIGGASATTSPMRGGGYASTGSIGASAEGPIGIGTNNSEGVEGGPLRPSPMIPWYAYIDRTAAQPVAGANGGAAGAGSPSLGGASPLPSSPAAEPWAEDVVRKEVALFYTVLPAPMASLEAFCAYGVQQVLSYYPSIVSIDGQTDLRKLTIGKKVSGCGERLGGQRSFSFTFATHGTATRKAEFGIAIGTCVEHRGYIIVLRSEKEAELGAYYKSVFIRHFRSADKFTPNASGLTYVAECTNAVMTDAQRLFGELRFLDTDAGISFALAMHPMTIRPDFSPTQTVGVGSIACMTFETEVFQRVEVDLLEENDDEGSGGAAEGGGYLQQQQQRAGARFGLRGGAGGLGSSAAAGGVGGGFDRGYAPDGTLLPPPAAGSELAELDMSRYKAASAVLFVDVELVSKQGYPTTMSINQYLQLKLKRLLDTFRDARLVGEAQAGQIGGRLSRSQHVTFTYEGSPRHAGVVKGLMTCTLVGNHGITALYFTRLTQGLFDHHLYLFQHLVRSVRFYGEGDLRAPFSRFNTRHKARLTDVELAKAYPQTVSVNEVKVSHLRALLASSDGRWEGATVYVVDPHSLVCVPKGDTSHASPASASQQQQPHAASSSSPNAAGDGDAGEREDGGDGHHSPAHGLASDEGSDELNGTRSTREPSDDPTVISVASVPHLSAAKPSTAASAPATPSKGGAEAADAAASPSSPTTAAERGGSGVTSPTAAEDEQQRLEGTANGLADTAGSGSSGRGGATTCPPLANTVAGVSSIGEGSVGGHAASPPPPGDDSPTNATADGAAETDVANGDGDGRAPPPPKSSALVEEVLAAEDNLYFGPSLRDLYCRCCEQVSCRPNSYLYNKLPRSSRFTEAIEELDLSSNYLGRQGFQAILNFLEHLPRIQTLIFNDMGLDNEDVRNMCECLERHPTVTAVHLRSNPKVSLPATRHLTRLIRANTRITALHLGGTSLGEGLVGRIEADAAANKK